MKKTQHNRQLIKKNILTILSTSNIVNIFLGLTVKISIFINILNILNIFKQNIPMIL